MEIAIQIFAWIGLAVVVSLSALTALVWCQWATDAFLKGRGSFRAFSFYIGMHFNAVGVSYPRYLAEQLWERYKKLAAENPVIDRHFRELMDSEPTQGATP